MTGFHLMRPEWLWLLVPAAVLVLLLWRERSRRGSWHSVISPDLLPYLVGENAGEKSRNLVPLIAAGWLLATLAAVGPSWEKIPQPIHQKQDALVVLLDLSYSMKSTDLAPSRLDRARQKILDLLATRHEGQTGLVAYAGDAHVVTPLTDDTGTIANLLPALHPDMMPVPGSATSGAVAEGIGLLQSAGIRGGRLLLVTDGVGDSEAERTIALVRKAGVQLSVMGVGTSTGAPIPLPRGGFLKDSEGAIVMPGLEAAALQRLATETNGRYSRMQISERDFDFLLANSGLDTATSTIALERSADTWNDQGYLFLPPLLLLALCLFRRGWLLSVLPVLFLATPEPAQAFEWNDLWLRKDQQGQRELEAGEYARAAELFENPDWAGTAAYHAGEYEDAAGHFKHSPANADALYNRGNALARAGRLDEAIESYRESLALQPDQQDARENLALLEQLKQQQEQQQEQQGESQDNDQQEGESGEGDQQQQGQQGQDSQEQQGQSGQQPSEQQSGQGSPDGDQQQGASDPGEDQRAEQAQARQQDGQPDETRQAQAQNAREDESGENGEKGDQQGQALQAARDDGEQERDQAMEQWLRRVPDDPSGLLREKFRYESERRAEQGETRNDEQYW